MGLNDRQSHQYEPELTAGYPESTQNSSDLNSDNQDHQLETQNGENRLSHVKCNWWNQFIDRAFYSCINVQHRQYLYDTRCGQFYTSTAAGQSEGVWESQGSLETVIFK